MQRYIGLDVHAASSILAVISRAGERLRTAVVETNGRARVEGIQMIPRHRPVRNTEADRDPSVRERVPVI